MSPLMIWIWKRLETLDLLQEMLSDYAGTIILVSHDRDFLDRVVTSVIYGAGDGRWTEYAGGYSDMVEQRGPVKLPVKTASRKNLVAVKNASVAKRKLSFKEKHALETLPGRISALEAAIAKDNNKLNNSDFFTRDPEGFQHTVLSLSATRQELEVLELEWLELEMLREELGVDL